MLFSVAEVSGCLARKVRGQRCRALLLGICLILVARILDAEPPVIADAEPFTPFGFTLVPDLPVASAGAAYQGSFSARGGKAPFSFLIISGGLPVGLALSARTGKVTGMPHRVGVAHFQLFARDAEGRFALLSTKITVESRLPPSVSISISPSSLSIPSGVSRQFDAIVKGTSNTAVVWSASAGSISTTGIFMAPPVHETTNIAVIATSVADKTKKASAAIAITPFNPLEIPAGQLLGNGAQGSMYNQAIAVRGGSPPYASNVTAGALPPGISLDAANSAGAQFKGMPTTPGTSNFTVQVCDTATTCVSAKFLLTVKSPALTIPSGQVCQKGFVGPGYTCAITATGGSQSYKWSVASGTLPAGLSLATVENHASITGSPTKAGSSTFTLKVSDSSAASQTATIALSISVNATAVCGFPTYSCARSDYATEPVTSMGTVPPDAGRNHCTAGAAGNLQSCGNTYGLNTMMTEPSYNNAKIVRITDYADIASKCVPVSGLGGAANYNVFSASSDYLLLACTGGTVRMKWFNPATMQINTSLDPRGWVLTSNGGIWQTSNVQVRFGYTTPDTFFNLAGTLINLYTVTNGVVNDATRVVADYSYAIPCWNSATNSTTPGGCGEWVQGKYQPGANVVPVRSNANPPHSFQLINSTPCTTGTTYPNFSAAAVTVPNTVPGFRALQYVLNDGTCQWADMWVPPGGGGKIPWSASMNLDKSDKIISATMSNHLGQDEAGACFVAVYDSVKNNYYHLNSCTGNVYTTSCAGGTGYSCASGTRTQAYVGNVYTDNAFPGGRNNRIVIHGTMGFKNGQWSNVGFNYCALVDMHGNKLYCPTTKPNAYYWQFGTSHMLNAFDWYGTGTPGHGFLGFNVLAYSNMTVYLQTTPSGRGPNKYQGRNLITNAWDRTYWDTSKHPCSPNPCFVPQLSTKGQPNGLDITAIGFDQHGSWVSNNGADNTPICMESYNASRGPDDGWLWPPAYPWLGEVGCFSTDGSSNVAREANIYNTDTSPYFNLQFNIGSYSSDGAWWAFSSDWWCTLGNSQGGATNVCGLPFQVNHSYQVGEYVGPIQMYAGVPGRIYQVTTAGTTDDKPIPAAGWCNTPGCTVKAGTAVLTYKGENNAAPGVFIVKLQ